MRKLILSINLSLDGFMSGPGQPLDWHLQCWTSEMGDELAVQLAKADTIVLGRVTFSGMASYWPARAGRIQCREEDFAYATMMNSYAKIVFSKTLRSASWHNTRMFRGNPAHEIGQLKKMPGKNLMLYGSGRLAAALISAGLVDEYQLWVHPVILGKGQPLFNQLQQRINLQLQHTKTFSTGVVTLYYRQL